MGRKLTTSQQDRLMSPIRTALIAMRMGTATSDHAHDVLGQLFIAYRICQIVPRHRHLHPEIRKADSEIHRFLTTQEVDIDAIELASEIYAALLKTTPLKTVRRAMLNVSEKVKNADAIHC